MCSIWENEIHYLKNDDFNKVLSRLDYIPLWINLSGGETFLNPELEQMLQTIAKKFPQALISLTSNGSFPERLGVVEQVPNPVVVLLSLDGDEKMHQQIRGHHAAYQNILKSLKKLDEIRLHKKNVSKTIAITLSEKNINHSFGFLNQKDFLDCSININLAQRSDYYQAPGELTVRSAIENLELVFKTIMRADLNSFYLYSYIKKMKHKSPSLRCSSVWAYTMVDSRLNVKDCTLKYKNLGSINDHIDLKDLRNKAKEDLEKLECYKNCESVCERFTHITTSYLNPMSIMVDALGYGFYYFKQKVGKPLR